MIKAVLFDCFGVLVTEAWLPFKARHFGDHPELLQQVSDLHSQANLGLISQQDFYEAAGSMCGLSADEVRRQLAANQPNEPLFEYIKEIKPLYKIGVLSNISGNYLENMLSPDQLALFDKFELSFESGYIKPQPGAFEAAARGIAVSPAECVMVDDQDKNVKSAESAGMKAILYRDVTQLRRDMAAITKD